MESALAQHDRIILHIDLDAFFCSVERLLNPLLQTLPWPIVVTEHYKYGIVAASDYNSRSLGIKSGMPLFRARNIANNFHSPLFVIQAHYEEYYAYHHTFVLLIKKFSTDYEIGSVDEVYMDISNKWQKYGSISNYCQIIQRTIFAKLRLRCKMGVSFTKYLAKLATNSNKIASIQTKSLKIISHNNHLAFLRDLPIRDIHYVGTKTAVIIDSLGIKTAFEFLQSKNSFLINKLLGKRHKVLIANLLGLTQTQINRSIAENFQSISISKTLHNGIQDRAEINKIITILFHHLLEKLLALQSVTRVVTLQLKYLRTVNNWTTYQKTLVGYTNQAAQLRSTIDYLLIKRHNKLVVGVGLSFRKLLNHKQTTQYLAYDKDVFVNRVIYQIINDVNNKLNICFVTTVSAYHKRSQLVKERFNFRRTL